MSCELLRNLNCSDNDFSDFKDGNPFENVRYLRSGIFNQCQLKSSSFFESLLSCNSLEYCDLSYNDFELCGFCNTNLNSRFTLKKLNMTSSGLKDLLIFCTLRTFLKLEYLNLSKNIFSSNTSVNILFDKEKTRKRKFSQISSSFQTHRTRILEENGQLEGLSSSKSLTIKFDYDLCNLKNCLEEIFLVECSILNDWKLLHCFLDCQKLSIIDISSNIFANKDSIVSFGQAKNQIWFFNMSNCLLDDSTFLAEILDFPNLRTLYLNDNNFNDLPNELIFGQSKDSLKILQIQSSKITNVNFLIAVSKCTQLEKLSISKNEFNNISNEFSLDYAANTLVEIEASACNFSSPIVLLAFTDCPNLKILNISCNQFNDIPDTFSFGSSRNSLIFLNVEMCNLGPSSFFFKLTDFPNLKFLNASHNNFFTDENNIEIGSSVNSLVHLKFNHFFQSITSQTFFKLTSFKQLINLAIQGKFPEEQYDLVISKKTLMYISILRAEFNTFNPFSICMWNCPNLKVLTFENVSFYLYPV